MPARWHIVVAGVAAGLFLTGCEPTASKERALASYVRGQILSDKGELDAAILELVAAIKADPNLSVAHAAIGDIHRRRGDHELAVHSYEQACQTNPYAFRPHYNLGVSYQALAEAAKAFQQAQQYLRQAVRVYLRAIAIEPDDFDANLNLGACYFQSGKYDLAEQYCKEAIRLDPASAAAYSNLGIIYDSQNRLYEAVNAYKTSLELDAHQPKILLNLGTTYLRQNRAKAALNVFDLAAKEDPDDPAPWEQMGACYFHVRDLPSATRAYRKAIDLDPRSASAHRGLGVVYMVQYLTRPADLDLRDRALACWHASLEIRPDQDDLLKLVRKYAPPPQQPPQL